MAVLTFSESCCAIVQATILLMTSLVTMPRTPPLGFTLLQLFSHEEEHVEVAWDEDAHKTCLTVLELHLFELNEGSGRTFARPIRNDVGARGASNVEAQVREGSEVCVSRRGVATTSHIVRS